MKNRKGFTLIELLVAITIIGIIILMVLPAITNLQRENQKKKFDDYERAVLEAAKAYEDQYEEDLFGRNTEGCASIDYKKLVDKKLLSTTKISGYECNHDTNGIIIRKVKGKSFYEVYLDCVKNGETKKLTENSNYNTIKNDQCNVGEDREAPILEIKCDGEAVPNGEYITGVNGNDGHKYYRGFEREKTIILPKLTVKTYDSNSGLEKNQYVTYEWKIYNQNINQQIDSPDSTEKNKTTFNIKDGSGSTAEKNVRIIEALKQEETTGKAIINLSGENIVDRAGNKLEASSKECTYYYDNAKPTMTITIIGQRTGTNYNRETTNWINEPVTIRVEVTDHTNNNIYVGIDENSFRTNETNLNLTLINENTNTYRYELLNQENVELNHNYSVCDKLGNCEEQQVNIKIDTIKPTCEITGDGNWDPDGANVTVNCEDSVISGVKTCAGVNGRTRKAHIKKDVEWTVEDNAGNTNTCIYYVISKKEYYQVNCDKYNNCEDSACGWNDCPEDHPETKFCGDSCPTQYWCCGTSAYQTNCSCKTYISCETEACGCKTWKTKGSWKDFPCNTNSCTSIDERFVYK